MIAPGTDPGTDPVTSEGLPINAMPRYDALDFCLLRAPALPVAAWHAALATPDGPLRAPADDERVRHGLVAAGSGLLDGLAKPAGDDKSRRRVFSRALRYLTRMSTRPTPFGAFSGVAVGEFGDRTTAALARTAVAAARVRADMGWLLALIKRVESDPENLALLNVTMNAMAHQVGDRLVLPSSDVHGKADRRSVRVRATAALDHVRHVAKAPVPFARVVAELNERFPKAGPERTTAFVTELVELGLLVTDLRPAVTDPRPEEHVLGRLVAAGLPEATTAPLREVVELTRRATAGDTGTLERLRATQRALVPDYKAQPFQVDSRLGLTGTRLGAQVADEVAEAVGCLARLSVADPGGYEHLVPYHQAFLERYGSDALVPVLELLSPERGLDAPNGYMNPPRAMVMAQPGGSGSEHTARALVALAADAWHRGAEEVELTDAVLEGLLPPGPEDTGSRTTCPAVDAYVQIRAAGPEAIDEGRWRAVLNSDGLGEGGRTFGRFFHLFDASVTDRLRAYARAREALEPDVVFAELSYVPAHGRGANVAIRPAVHDHEIPVNVTASVAPEYVIDLADIHVGATDDGLRLYSARLGRELVVVQNHMLSPLGAPNACRFLLEVSRARYRIPAGFTWGPVEGAPYLPRVVRGRVVLRAAEWTLHPKDGDVPRTAGEVERWRRRWNVPRHVYLADDDNRLLLDLEHPACVAELLTDLRAATGAVTIQEALPGPADDELWLRDAEGRGYLSEVVIPLISVHQEARTAAVDIARKADPAAHVSHLPGSAWSYLKLYAARDLHDEIAATELPVLVRDLRGAVDLDRWFYIRYADPDPHLRIRVRTWSACQSGTAAHTLLVWGESLVRRGLASRLELATYHPEISRYGGPAAYDAVERFFEANSEVSTELLRLVWDGELDPEAVTIAAVDALYAQWGLDVRERLAAMPRPAEDKEARERYKKDRDYLCELLAPWDRRPHPLGRAHHERLAAVLDRQADAVRRAAHAVAGAEAAGTLWGTRDAILASLAHMQVNRLLPMDRPAENRCYLVWGHVLGCLRGRPRD
ncbi:lantibiotic dehydratase [Streptomyces sp. NPDC049837]|uniref:lantibiotic dehydratase n=1 Tax=Streptomyces sp. NPDC049837 TaxID=3155277 RepID=UPI00341DCB8C